MGSRKGPGKAAISKMAESEKRKKLEKRKRGGLQATKGLKGATSKPSLKTKQE